MSINNVVNQARDMYQSMLKSSTTFEVAKARTFMKSTLNSPTQGMLAEHKINKEYANRLNDSFKQNAKVVDNDFVVKSLNKQLVHKANKMYPKTMIARQYFVDKEQVVVDSVKPKSQHKLKDRINILIRKFASYADELYK